MAGYINKIKTRPNSISVIIIKYLPNKLTLLCFKIYYKKEKYLKVRTAVFKYITSPYSKGSVYEYVGILVY